MWASGRACPPIDRFFDSRTVVPPHSTSYVRSERFGFGDGAQFKDVGGVGALLSGVGGSKISHVCATV